MTTKKTILIHGLLTAGALGLVGYFMAQVAGMWIASTAPVRPGLESAPDPTATTISNTLAWRLPFSMAAIGFIFVVLGESVMSAWRKPKPTDTTPSQSEEETQRMLRELILQETNAMQPVEVPEAVVAGRQE